MYTTSAKYKEAVKQPNRIIYNPCYDHIAAADSAVPDYCTNRL